MTQRTMCIEHRIFPIRGVFRISRGAKTEAHTVEVTIREGAVIGRGECVPYAHYGETVASVLAELQRVRDDVEAGMDLTALQAALPPGSARNAVDCALWDLRSRLTGVPVATYANLPGPLQPVTTAFTISLDTPEVMARQALACGDMPLLKLKLGGDGDDARVRAVRQAVPSARIIADANESWTVGHLHAYLREFAALGVELLEQPLPAGADEALRMFASPVPLAADESCRDERSIPSLVGKYAFANLKLDKAGGLTEALRMAATARAAGLRVMVGCMVGSSLSMAPGIVLAQFAEMVHLDGPLLLAHDAEPGYRYEGATLRPDADVWSC